MKTVTGLLLCLNLIACVGCGPTLGEVKGKVTVDGEPGANLLVAFAPTGTGVLGSCVTDENGNYMLVSNLGNGIPPGNYRVAITTQTEIDESMTSSSDAESDDEEEYTGGSDSADYAAAAAGKKDEYEQRKEKIPAKYNSQTELQEEITSGLNEINFEIET